MNFDFFKRILSKRKTPPAKAKLIIIFSAFAILSNFTGIEINGPGIHSDVLLSIGHQAAIANTRVLTIGVSGLVIGPFVGTIVGIISGIVRLFQGGEAAYTYFISSVLVGLISGLIGKRYVAQDRYPSVQTGILSGTLMESIQMACILIFYPNLHESWALVQTIALPMIFMNSLGTALFLSIILRTLKQEESARAIQTHDVLELANHTLPYFSAGLNEESCAKAARYIHQVMRVAAVSITNTTSILAHVGAGSDHHIPTKKIITDLSKRVLQTGRMQTVHTKEEIGCNHADCPLSAAIVVPLYSRKRIVGTLKFYFTDSNKLTYVEEQLAEGLAKIFSSQIELGEIDLQSRLLKDAEIKSLQAQVNPHFFFNAVNTISAMIRVNSEQARTLLLQLSHFFRGNLQGARSNLIPLKNELEQVNAYLAIEQARFPNRYQVCFDIDEKLLYAAVPPFVLQVLIENALKHAFGSKKEDNIVQVSVQQQQQSLLLIVSDNGHGIDPTVLPLLGKQLVPSSSGTGSALENLNRRLESLFGQKAQLHFDSSPHGTTITCQLPANFLDMVESNQ